MRMGRTTPTMEPLCLKYVFILRSSLFPANHTAMTQRLFPSDESKVLGVFPRPQGQGTCASPGGNALLTGRPSAAVVALHNGLALSAVTTWEGPSRSRSLFSPYTHTVGLVDKSTNPQIDRKCAEQLRENANSKEISRTNPQSILPISIQISGHWLPSAVHLKPKFNTSNLDYTFKKN